MFVMGLRQGEGCASRCVTCSAFALPGNLQLVRAADPAGITCYNFTVSTKAHSRLPRRRNVTRFMRRLVFGNARGQGT